ncbi:armadillo-type protein [Naematelia encephala]|uniref:Armadillo-type protein n=1 Tax=Naematelia encephala TaxID=71784 RepID=A0A1Y2B0I1_9TREE|nr:armadillo-type protein [Naematelia encephala]
MSTTPNLNNNGDSVADLGARTGALHVLDDPYNSPAQATHYSISPSSQSFQTPATRAGPYTPYTDDGPQYPTVYYNHVFPSVSTGPPTAAYPYGGAPPDMSGPPMGTGPLEETTFPSLNDAYPTPESRRTGIARASGPSGLSSNSTYRPPHAQDQTQLQHQQHLQQHQHQQQQQQQQQQQHQYQQNPYFGYGGDQRQFWMGHPGNFVANERKKEAQIGGPLGTPTSQAHRFTQPPQSPFTAMSEFLSSPTPTHTAFSITSPGTPSFHPSVAGAHQYGLHQAPSFGLRSPYGAISLPARQFHAPAYRGAASRRFEEAQLPRSALLEDFRITKMQKKWELKEIYGHIVEFSGDQHGSRLIQQRLETANSEDRERIFEEIMPNAYQLMTDVFGNYVMQKLFEYGDQRQKAALAKKMEGHVFALSMQMYGCRVVQKALEHVLVAQRESLVTELEAHILECVKSANANHVIQRLIALGAPNSIPKSFVGHVEELATHPYGCRVLQKSFENLPDEVKRDLLDEMHLCTRALIEDQFGNYVVQSVITMGIETDRTKVIGTMKGQIIPLSRHKFASNVCEKAIIYGSLQDRRDIIRELIGSDGKGKTQIPMLLRDQFGNFPLQTALKHADGDQRQQLIDHIKPELELLGQTPVGKRLTQKLAEMEAETFVATPQTNDTALASTDASVSGEDSAGPMSPVPRAVNKLEQVKVEVDSKALEDLLQSTPPSESERVVIAENK